MHEILMQKEWSARKVVAQVYLGLKINQSSYLVAR